MNTASCLSGARLYKTLAVLVLPLALIACGSDNNNNTAPALAAPNLASLGDQSFPVNEEIEAVSFTNSGGGSLLADNATPNPGCAASDNLPSGLRVTRTSNGNSCQITGTPDAAAAEVTVMVTARNATGADATPASVKITVTAPPMCSDIERADVTGYPIDTLTVATGMEGETGNSKLYVRGNHSSWNPQRDFLLEYKGMVSGNQVYQAVAVFDKEGAVEGYGGDTAGGTAETQFKIASDDGSWSNQFFATASDNGHEISTDPLALDQDYKLFSADGGTDNNRIDLVEGNSYSFTFTFNGSANLNRGDMTTPNEVGTLNIVQCTATPPVAVTVKPTLDDITGTESVPTGAAIEPVIFTNSAGAGGGGLLSDDATPTAGCTATGLPAGLSVERTRDGHSCQIVGKPTTVAAAAAVTVTATNSIGNDSATVSIAVTLGAPNLPAGAASFPATVEIEDPHVLANNGGGSLHADDATPTAGCTASSNLPAGLAVERTKDENSCQITGTPTTMAAAVSVMVTATNATGNNVAVVMVTIDAAPAAPNLDDISGTRVVYRGERVDIAFANSGGGHLLANDATPTAGCVGVNSPSGTTVSRTDDRNSCQISGVAHLVDASVSDTIVEVTATNPTGSDTTKASATLALTTPPTCSSATLPDGTGYPIDTLTVATDMQGETGNSKLYVRGNHSNWQPQDDFLLEYKGMVNSKEVYRAVAVFDSEGAAGDYGDGTAGGVVATQFKIASDDGSWTNQFVVRNADNSGSLTTPLIFGQEYTLTSRGDPNNIVHLIEGNSYSFTFTSDSPADLNEDTVVGKLTIVPCRP